jgi:DNA (cytosine-5)-methyltransferase 1
MHFVSDSDRTRFEQALRQEWRKNGLSLDADGDVKVDGKLLKRDFARAGTGWIAHQPRSTPGVSHIFMGDVRQLAGKRILDTIGLKPGELDMVFGGPPCQGFSTSGKRNVADPRNNLVFEWARFVIEMKPKTLIMENVPGILSMVTPDGLPVIDVLIRILEDGGFAGVDALKRCIAQQTGAIGLVRGKSKSKRAKAGRSPETAADGDDDQLALFDGAAA